MKIRRYGERTASLYPRTENNPSRTLQSPKDSCDINIIVERFKQTGELPSGNPMPPRFGDFAHALDYQSALNSVMNAHDEFDNLPSATRARFGNDPLQLLTFLDTLDDPKNLAEAGKLGLVDPNLPPHQPAPTAGQEPPAEGDPDASPADPLPAGDGLPPS